MTISRNALCAVYALIGLAALIGTWGNNIAYLEHGFVAANLLFWQETLATPASQSITVDILFLSLSVIVWMLLEARRLAMRGAWLYILFGVFVAIAAAVPFFLFHRERTLAAVDGSVTAGRLAVADGVGILVIAVLAAAYAVHSLAV